ncbi:MAG: sigma-70 family RNA polymerase sigma factor [Planctomycetaceae bacterium]|nr:sigma-70 family RNA polymerase sigma factor [Planctomycetaceae bacterium]
MALTDIDKKLIKRCLAEEPGAWKDFVDRFLGLFIHVIRHTATARSAQLSEQDVEDICSEVFLQLLANDFQILARFKGKSSLATYLTVVSRRIVVREITQRRKAEALGHVTASRSSLDQAAASIEVDRWEDREQVRSLMNELPVNEAEIVKQYHLEGRSYREISNSLGVPENTIGPTLTRARSRMKGNQVRS